MTKFGSTTPEEKAAHDLIFEWDNQTLSDPDTKGKYKKSIEDRWPELYEAIENVVKQQRAGGVF